MVSSCCGNLTGLLPAVCLFYTCGRSDVVFNGVSVWCQACEFVDGEAEVSDDCGSEDDEDGSDLDSLDGSFIDDDDTQLTQAPAATHG